MKIRSDLDYLWTGAQSITRAYMTRCHIRMPQPNLETQAEIVKPSFGDMYSRLSIMSERRTILSRPRTKVYESNYNIGESYYKPMVDHLDRKYSGRPLFPPSPPRDFSSPRRALDDEFLRDKDLERASSQSRASRIKEDFLERASHATKDADSFFDRHGRRTEADHFLDRASHHKSSETQDFFDKAVTKAEESFSERSQSLRNKADALVEKAMSRATLDDEDDIIESQLKRIKEKRAAKAAARDEDLEFTLNAISSAADSQSQLRARQNQIRVSNVSSELSALQERTEARTRRRAELQSLLAENDALSALSQANHDRSLATENALALRDLSHDKFLAYGGLRDIPHHAIGLRDLSHNALGLRDLSHSSLGVRDLSHVNHEKSVSHLSQVSHGNLERSYGLGLKSLAF